MKQEEVTTDEQAKEFIRQWAREEGRFPDLPHAAKACSEALHNFDHAHNTMKMSVQDALQKVLEIAQM